MEKSVTTVFRRVSGVVVPSLRPVGTPKPPSPGSERLPTVTGGKGMSTDYYPVLVPETRRLSLHRCQTDPSVHPRPDGLSSRRSTGDGVGRSKASVETGCRNVSSRVALTPLRREELVRTGTVFDSNWKKCCPGKYITTAVRGPKVESKRALDRIDNESRSDPKCSLHPTSRPGPLSLCRSLWFHTD